MEKKLTLNEILEKSKKFINQEITQEELQQWADKLMVRSYIPIEEKKKRITKVLFDFVYDFDVEEKMMQLEMNKFWYFILAYLFIEIEEDEEDLLTVENYDVIFPIFYNWLYNYIIKDYECFLKMFELYHKTALELDTQTLISELSNTDWSKFIESNEKFFTELGEGSKTIDVLKELSALTQGRDLQWSENFIEEFSKTLQKVVNDSKSE